MSSVGQQIREQRLRLGLKLDEISARSRISLKMLQAIEADDFAGISSPFLYKSFTRQFAGHIKLDYASLAGGVDAAAESMPQPRMPGEELLGKIDIAPLPMKGHGKSFRWLYSVASLGVMLVACSSVYGLWQSSKPSWLASLGTLMHPTANQPSATQPSAANASEKPLTQDPRAAVREPAHSTATLAAARPSQRPAPGNDGAPHAAAADDQSLAAVEPAAAPSADSVDSFRVELSALEPTWLSIVQDGKQTFSGVLDSEHTKVLEGHENARVRTGNAGGISCIFNGKSIGPLGPRGQVRTVVFTKSNYEIVDAPAHIALTQYPAIVE